MDNFEEIEFFEILFDEHGNPFKKLRDKINKADIVNGFVIYDSTHGHCELCGRLGCNANCFKLTAHP